MAAAATAPRPSVPVTGMPGCRPGARRRGGGRTARAVTTAATVAGLAAAAVAGHRALAASFGLLDHPRWAWVLVAAALESASMAAFAIMLRRLLAAGGTAVSVGRMLATTYAANALSVSIPLAGPEVATAFTFRRFSRQGAGATLAGWSLLAGGVFSFAAAALVVAGGGLVSGNFLVTGIGVATAAVLVALGAAARRPWLRAALEPLAARTLRHWPRRLRRPAGDPREIVRAWADRLGSIRLSPSGSVTVTALALTNWLADAAVLAVGIHAAGAAVPWHDLLLVYGSGIAAQSLALTPGGLGVAEGTISAALVAAGLPASRALAAVLFYRLASFWLVASAGWLIVLWLRRPRRATHQRPRRSRAWPEHPVTPIRVSSTRGRPEGLAAGAPSAGKDSRCHATGTIITTAGRRDRRGARIPGCGLASGSPPNGPPAGAPRRGGGSWLRSRPSPPCWPSSRRWSR